MDNNENRPIVYVVSDSIGDTAEFVVKAVASQYDTGKVKMRRIPFVEDREQIRSVVQEAAGNKAIIAYTLIVPELRQAMVEEAAAHEEVPTADILGSLIEAFNRTTSEQPVFEPGKVRRLDENYFRRVDAVEFAVKHDDGKNPRGLLKADVVLVGISRTSKTPLSMYLAHQGLKAANVPLVPEVELPEELFWIDPQKIIGLIIDPHQLRAIRKERLKSLGLEDDANYIAVERIEEELAYARRVMKKIGCTVFDVSKKAVEEVASRIIQVIKGGQKE
ncbi:MAG: pyruvate, water dikinase regulatory protein [Bacillota bacterium]|nr:pyruvate, water dikinase regulatory protein [Bacillota bacterium]